MGDGDVDGDGKVLVGKGKRGYKAVTKPLR